MFLARENSSVAFVGDVEHLEWSRTSNFIEGSLRSCLSCHYVHASSRSCGLGFIAGCRCLSMKEKDIPLRLI